MKLKNLELTQQTAYWKFQHKQAKEKIGKPQKIITDPEGIIKKIRQLISLNPEFIRHLYP